MRGASLLPWTRCGGPSSCAPCSRAPSVQGRCTQRALMQRGKIGRAVELNQVMFAEIMVGTLGSPRRFLATTNTFRQWPPFGGSFGFGGLAIICLRLLKLLWIGNACSCGSPLSNSGLASPLICFGNDGLAKPFSFSPTAHNNP